MLENNREKTDTDGRPRELVIYECRGTGSPRGEPGEDGFLGIWPEIPFYYLFFDRPAPAAVDRWVAEQPGWSLTEVYRMAYEQWQDMARTSHRVGPFVIETGISAGAKGGGEDGAIPIRLHPGVTFGSGVHPTTRGCLLAISDLFGAKRRPESVVDLGTGTGILSLACARLGASRILAIDCNALAVKETVRNIRANGLDTATTVHVLVAGSLDVVKTTADLLLMNLEWPCLQKVIREENWQRFPRVVLSGFLESRWQELRDMIPARFETLWHVVIDDWVTAVVGGVSSEQ